MNETCSEQQVEVPTETSETLSAIRRPAVPMKLRSAFSPGTGSRHRDRVAARNDRLVLNGHAGDGLGVRAAGGVRARHDRQRLSGGGVKEPV